MIFISTTTTKMSSYFGDEAGGDFVHWSSAEMIGKGSFSIVYRARLKNVSVSSRAPAVVSLSVPH